MKLTRKKAIILVAAIFMFFAVSIMSMTNKDVATGKVAKVTMQARTSAKPTEEGVSKANPYKKFMIVGAEMPDEYKDAVDKFLKDDLEATEVTVLEITGKYEEETLYYCTVNSYEENTYLEVCPPSMGVPCVISQDTPSANTGVKVEDVEAMFGGN